MHARLLRILRAEDGGGSASVDGSSQTFAFFNYPWAFSASCIGFGNAPYACNEKQAVGRRLQAYCPPLLTGATWILVARSSVFGDALYGP